MEITLTDEQIRRLSNGEDIIIKAPCKNEWKWSYPKDEEELDSYYKINPKVNYENCIKYGLYRLHKENAKQALQLNRETNLIGAIAEQLFPNDTWKANWKDSYQPKYYVYTYKDSTRYYVDHDYYRMLGVHYMSEEVAKAVCKVLNEDKVKLKD